MCVSVVHVPRGAQTSEALSLGLLLAFENRIPGRLRDCVCVCWGVWWQLLLRL